MRLTKARGPAFALTIGVTAAFAAAPQALGAETPALPVQVCVTGSPAPIANPVPCPSTHTEGAGANGASGAAGSSGSAGASGNAGTNTSASGAAPANPGHAVKVRARAKVKKHATRRRHRSHSKRRTRHHKH